MNTPGFSSLQRIYRNLSPAEFILFAALLVALTIGVVGMLLNLQDSVSSELPTDGGELTIGIVGTPRYLNPVLANSTADKDINQFIYAGLTKLNPDGQITMDLAENVEISADGTRYQFTLRDEATFSDSQPVTAEDILFTVEMIQNQQIASPNAADWSGVTVQSTDSETVVFELEEPFAGFLANTTTGILPTHYWQGVSPQNFPFATQNNQPVGAGAFELSETERGEDSVVESYELTRRSGVADGYIDTVNTIFFPSETELLSALSDGTIDSAYNISPQNVTDFDNSSRYQIHTAPLNRIFAVFFNQNENRMLADKNVRQALSNSVDREKLVDIALSGYATPISGPLPATNTKRATAGGLAVDAASSSEAVDRAAAAEETLATAGWEKNDSGTLTNADGEAFTLTLTTGEIPALEKSAEYLASVWKELGVAVEIETVSSTKLSGSVIRPREYEALLFGQSINRSGDLYPFWHSGEQSDPGLNLAMYVNTDVDDQLEELRETRDEDERAELKKQVAQTIAVEYPAVFLYTPDFISVSDSRLGGVSLPSISMPSDRLAGFEDWYTNTRNLWNVFKNNNDETAPAAEQASSTATSSQSTSTNQATGSPAARS